MGYDLRRKLDEAREELEYQETLHRQGEAEQRRMEFNRAFDSDYLGFDDGRPGFSWDFRSGFHGGLLAGVPVELLPRIVISLVLGLIGFGLWLFHSCAGPPAPAGTASVSGAGTAPASSSSSDTP